MYAPPGYDTDTSGEEDESPPPSAPERSRPHFSFKSIFTPTRKLNKRAESVAAAQQSPSTEDVGASPPTNTLGVAVPTLCSPPKSRPFRKTVRIITEGEEDPNPPPTPGSAGKSKLQTGIAAIKDAVKHMSPLLHSERHHESQIVEIPDELVAQTTASTPPSPSPASSAHIQQAVGRPPQNLPEPQIPTSLSSGKTNAKPTQKAGPPSQKQQQQQQSSGPSKPQPQTQTRPASSSSNSKQQHHLNEEYYDSFSTAYPDGRPLVPPGIANPPQPQPPHSAQPRPSQSDRPSSSQAGHVPPVSAPPWNTGSQSSQPVPPGNAGYPGYHPPPPHPQYWHPYHPAYHPYYPYPPPNQHSPYSTSTARDGQPQPGVPQHEPPQSAPFPHSPWAPPMPSPWCAFPFHPYSPQLPTPPSAHFPPQPSVQIRPTDSRRPSGTNQDSLQRVSEPAQPSSGSKPDSRPAPQASHVQKAQAGSRQSASTLTEQQKLAMQEKLKEKLSGEAKKAAGSQPVVRPSSAKPAQAESASRPLVSDEPGYAADPPPASRSARAAEVSQGSGSEEEALAVERQKRQEEKIARSREPSAEGGDEMSEAERLERKKQEEYKRAKMAQAKASSQRRERENGSTEQEGQVPKSSAAISSHKSSKPSGGAEEGRTTSNTATSSKAVVPKGKGRGIEEDKDGSELAYMASDGEKDGKGTKRGEITASKRTPKGETSDTSQEHKGVSGTDTAGPDRKTVKADTAGQGRMPDGAAKERVRAARPPDQPGSNSTTADAAAVARTKAKMRAEMEGQRVRQVVEREQPGRVSSTNEPLNRVAKSATGADSKDTPDSKSRSETVGASATQRSDDRTGNPEYAERDARKQAEIRAMMEEKRAKQLEQQEKAGPSSTSMLVEPPGRSVRAAKEKAGGASRPDRPGVAQVKGQEVEAVEKTGQSEPEDRDARKQAKLRAMMEARRKAKSLAKLASESSTREKQAGASNAGDDADSTKDSKAEIVTREIQRGEGSKDPVSRSKDGQRPLVSSGELDGDGVEAEKNAKLRAKMEQKRGAEMRDADPSPDSAALIAGSTEETRLGPAIGEEDRKKAMMDEKRKADLKRKSVVVESTVEPPQLSQDDEKAALEKRKREKMKAMMAAEAATSREQAGSDGEGGSKGDQLRPNGPSQRASTGGNEPKIGDRSEASRLDQREKRDLGDVNDAGPEEAIKRRKEKIRAMAKAQKRGLAPTDRGLVESELRQRVKGTIVSSDASATAALAGPSDEARKREKMKAMMAAKASQEEGKQGRREPAPGTGPVHLDKGQMEAARDRKTRESPQTRSDTRDPHDGSKTRLDEGQEKRLAGDKQNQSPQEENPKAEDVEEKKRRILKATLAERKKREADKSRDVKPSAERSSTKSQNRDTPRKVDADDLTPEQRTTLAKLKQEKAVETASKGSLTLEEVERAARKAAKARTESDGSLLADRQVDCEMKRRQYMAIKAEEEEKAKARDRTQKEIADTQGKANELAPSPDAASGSSVPAVKLRPKAASQDLVQVGWSQFLVSLATCLDIANAAVRRAISSAAVDSHGSSTGQNGLIATLIPLIISLSTGGEHIGTILKGMVGDPNGPAGDDFAKHSEVVFEYLRELKRRYELQQTSKQDGSSNSDWNDAAGILAQLLHYSDMITPKMIKTLTDALKDWHENGFSIRTTIMTIRSALAKSHRRKSLQGDLSKEQEEKSTTLMSVFDKLAGFLTLTQPQAIPHDDTVSSDALPGGWPSNTSDQLKTAATRSPTDQHAQRNSLQVPDPTRSMSADHFEHSSKTSERQQQATRSSSARERQGHPKTSHPKEAEEKVPTKTRDVRDKVSTALHKLTEKTSSDEHKPEEKPKVPKSSSKSSEPRRPVAKEKDEDAEVIHLPMATDEFLHPGRHKGVVLDSMIRDDSNEDLHLPRTTDEFLHPDKPSPAHKQGRSLIVEDENEELHLPAVTEQFLTSTPARPTRSSRRPSRSPPRETQPLHIDTSRRSPKSGKTSGRHDYHHIAVEPDTPAADRWDLDSSPSRYSQDDSASDGTIESDGEARMLLAQADSGPARYISGDGSESATSETTITGYHVPDEDELESARELLYEPHLERLPKRL